MPTGKMVVFPTPDSATVRLRFDGDGSLFDSVREVVAGRPAAVVHIGRDMPNGNGWSRETVADGYVTMSEHGIVWFDKVNPATGSVAYDVDTITLVKVPENPRPFARSGLVYASGRSWCDDHGLFFPLGHTLFWAPRGWKFERDRLEQNLAYLSGWGDYIRILCAVDWRGNEIDPDWPDYQTVMAELIDCCYDRYGLRVEPVLHGGGTWDVVRTAQMMAEVAQGRHHKVMHWEVANESFKNGPELDVLKRAGQTLLDRTPNLVALSTPVDGSLNTAEAWGCSSALTLHLDRTYADDGWRHVRQGWDFQQADRPASSNEPIGPRSSVAEECDPLRLAMSRATSVMCGAGAYVFHSGAAVYGVAHQGPTGWRPANVWEVPDVAGMLVRVRGATGQLPAGLCDWAVANDGWAVHGNPLEVEDWDRGPVKNYGALGAGQFVSMPHGIHGHLLVRAQQALTYRAHDPLGGDVVSEGSLAAGQLLELPGDPAGRQCAYVIVGQLH